MARKPKKSTDNMKRELIYSGERLKEITRESTSPFEEKHLFEAAPSLTEDEKRRSIYVTERLLRLQDEREAMVANRDELAAAL